MATNNRTFGEAVKRQTVWAEFKQYFLEKFLDNKWWQKILIIVPPAVTFYVLGWGNSSVQISWTGATNAITQDFDYNTTIP